ncbi:nucleotidyltransferase domain-containing protein [Armatimonas sp.]|uniref:nucleotidyltransferase domain-containing protein n=1 Tax=Armatimonas sp. TaxID=1872638 RepID=UPI00286B6D6D|nr:nucleotidyltransferase domain-containing protein [Armatimonas sp.]
MTTRERYEAAIASLTEKLQKDRTILAAVLFGSLAYDDVWEKSDIDLGIIGEEFVKEMGFTLYEEGISVHAFLMPRSKFRKTMEGALQGSFWSSLLPRSRLLFTKDDSLALLWESAGTLGERDKQSQLLCAATACLPVLTKAEKWHHVKRDFHYTAVYLLQTAMQLAAVEVLAAGQSPGREVIQQALKLNPAFFHRVYTDVLDGPKTDQSLGEALSLCDAYLTERIPLCFSPLLHWLEDADGPRSTQELNAHFKHHWHAEHLDLACDWLADKGILDRVGIPLRLTKDSRVTVDEAGYVFVGGL